ncbi:MAG: hypothetical protein KAJ16_05570 [Calditrichia bacterium]|nr:hypothetical protein [Calditrichia bacterium]
MEKETIDLRNLMLMIKEKKEIECTLALEFDCKIEVENIESLIKVINYAINYISQLANQPMQISLYAGYSEHTLVFTAFTVATEFPPISENVSVALVPYNATISFDGEAGKFAQIKLAFQKEQAESETPPPA